MAEEISSLTKQRGVIKSHLTRFENVLKAINSQTDLKALDLEERLKTHLTLWDKFNSIQDEIEQLMDETPQNVSVNEGERLSFEERFYQVSGLAKKHLEKLQISTANSSTESRSPSNFLEREDMSNPTSRFNLPKLRTPTFNGSFDTWLSFYDSFKSMCHDNSAISSIQKFHYLKACLQGEAAEVIASLETSAENYAVAWELLKHRYNNKRFIVDTHLKALFDIPQVSREFSIQALTDNVQKRLRALEVLKRPIGYWDDLLIFIIRKKLNNYTLEKWEEQVGDTEFPTMKDMIAFLERRALIENTYNSNKQSTFKKAFSKDQLNSRQNSRTSQNCMTNTVSSNSSISKNSCPMCSENHALFSCSQFRSLSPTERYKEVKRASICHNCFNSNHRTIECRKGPCSKCQKKHNILLHFDRKAEASSSTEQANKVQNSASDSATDSSLTVQSQKIEFHSPAQVFLGTALIDVLDIHGDYRPCRAFLDGGSQCNAITEKCAARLGLRKQKVDIELRGVENLKTNIKYVTSTSIRSRVNNSQFNLSFLVFQNVSSQLPLIEVDRKSIQIPNNVRLADPEFHKPSDVDILIGAEYFYNLLGSGKIRCKNLAVSLRETELGWIVVGSVLSSQKSKGPFPEFCSAVNCDNLPLLWEVVNPKLSNERSATLNSLNSKFPAQALCNFIKYDTLPLLWELGDEDSSKKILSKEEELCEQHFCQNTKRDATGRYVVKLPFNKKKECLGNSRNTAVQRLQALERRFDRDPQVKSHYVECIEGYIEQGHMSLINSHQNDQRGFYLPHHAVIKSDSLTTKTRVVFDGSAKTSTGVSLNETLMVGPTIQQELFTIVLRFRSFLYAMTADIQQMYRQIRVDPEDRAFQKILWRKEPAEPIQTYTLSTVTFGTACAPFLAVRTLHQLAKDEGESFPLASSVLRQDFYVDDLLTGAQSFEEASKLRDELIELLKRGGFHLRKWGANSPELMRELSQEISDPHLILDPTETIKTLGLCWDCSTDLFQYKVKLPNSTDPITKRIILSQTARLFDPLGLLGPVIVVAKILIQEIWKIKLDWDSLVSSEIKQKWLDFQGQLPSLDKLRISRCITTTDTVEVQIHGFADASEKGYGACLYLRSSNSKDERHVALICSKSRVAPLKQVTLPRLELCAANLLAHLYVAVRNALQMQIDKAFFWSDSTIVLSWINTPSHTLKTFVANRVSEIQTLTQPHSWRHVPTDQNPADFISRGQYPAVFLDNKVWFDGPPWLHKNSNDWPNTSFQCDDVPERKKSSQVLSLKITVSETNILEKYSDLGKLQRVLAYCMRYIQNLKIKNDAQRNKGVLSINELNLALVKIINLTQEDVFSKELRDLSRGREVEPTSSLYKLNPFLDKDIIRVGGRLEFSDLCESQKHPIVLPKGHQVTRMIIYNEHIKRGHAGTNATLYGVRERYWPIDGRNMTRHLIRQCVRCFRAKPREINYLMGALPKERTSSARPFTHTGLDYCGPFFVKENRFRNRTKVKTYVAVFVCFSTKAVHLELVSDLTTEAFLAGLKRFFSRRGRSSTIHSDNATNFVGACRELKELYKHIEEIERNEKVQRFFTNEGVSWHFIPPRAPHHGGLWEAAVKSFKTHFTRVAGNALLNYEQLHTYVVEIEAILNSRPLSNISSDPNDCLPLTPGHFLIGSSLTTFPQEDLQHIPINRLSCWQHIQQMRQHFWNRWHREYLNEMICRSKWYKCVDQSIIKVGTLVVMKEDNLPPMAWKLARIVQLHPGRDGIIRTVTVRNASSVFKRPLKNLYPLPIESTKE